MTDIVERLRDLALRFGKCRDQQTCTDAADEIERLRKAVTDIVAECGMVSCFARAALKGKS